MILRKGKDSPVKILALLVDLWLLAEACRVEMVYKAIDGGKRRWLRGSKALNRLQHEHATVVLILLLRDLPACTTSTVTQTECRAQDVRS